MVGTPSTVVLRLLAAALAVAWVIAPAGSGVRRPGVVLVHGSGTGVRRERLLPAAGLVFVPWAGYWGLLSP